MHEPIIIIESRRLKFRRMSLDDLDFVAEMLGHPEVMKYYPQCYNRAESVEWIERQLRRYTEFGIGLWLVCDRISGEPVGQIGPAPFEFDEAIHAEVGYLVHRPFWRRGYATEGAIAVRDYIFYTLDQERAFCTIRPENLPSRGVAEKAGFTRIPGRVIERSGLDHWVYYADRSDSLGGTKRERVDGP